MYNDMAVPESVAAPADSLVIPLDNAVEKLRNYSKFNLVHAILIIIVLLLTQIIYAFYSARVNMALYVSGIFWVLISFSIISNIRSARKNLLLYKNGAPAVITLNSDGLELPVALLVNDSMKDDLLNAGLVTITLFWQDITSWNIFNSSRGMTANHLLIIEKDIFTPNGNYVKRSHISIERCLSKSEEKLLLDFAQRFLIIKIKKPGFY